MGIQNKNPVSGESASNDIMGLGLGFRVYLCFGICKLRRCVQSGLDILLSALQVTDVFNWQPFKCY